MGLLWAVHFSLISLNEYFIEINIEMMLVSTSIEVLLRNKYFGKLVYGAFQNGLTVFKNGITITGKQWQELIHSCGIPMYKS